MSSDEKLENVISLGMNECIVLCNVFTPTRKALGF